MWEEYKSGIWRHQCSIYRNAAKEAGKQYKLAPTPIATGVRCIIAAIEEVVAGTDIGKNPVLFRKAVDEIHMDLGVDVEPSDFILITSGPESVGNWYEVKGRAEAHSIFENTVRVSALRSEGAPPGYVA